MRIQAKITVLVTVLTALVAGSIAATLLWLEHARVREDAAERVRALMEGVLRISREAVTAKDDLMLMSYLRHLMREYPEIEVAAVSVQGYSSVMGEVKSELFYRTVTASDKESSEFRRAEPNQRAEASASARSKNVRSVGAVSSRSMPPGTVTVRLGFSKAAVEAQVRHAQAAVGFKILSIAAVALLLGLAGSLWLGRVLARPIEALASAADRIGEGRFDARVEAKGKDEVSHLARRFNDMAGRLEELLRFKEDLMGTLSHEMRAPLTGLKGFLELFLDSPTAARPRAELERVYRTMFDSVGQLEVSLANAMDLFQASKPELRLEDVPVRDVAAEVLRLFEPTARLNGVKLVASVPLRTRVQADRELLRRALVNLVLNAVSYTPPGGTVRLEASEEGGRLRLAVADTGPGIPEEFRDKIFEKFYRAPGPGGRQRRVPGSGLGLAIAKRAVELQGGKIWVDSVVGKGSTFSVELASASSAEKRSVAAGEVSGA